MSNYDSFGGTTFNNPSSNFGGGEPGSGNPPGVDPEMKSFLEMESQKAQLQAQIHKLNDTCWDICMDKPREKLDGRTETCLCNCVDRFIDTSLLVANRFQQLFNKSH